MRQPGSAVGAAMRAVNAPWHAAPCASMHMPRFVVQASTHAPLGVFHCLQHPVCAASDAAASALATQVLPLAILGVQGLGCGMHTLLAKHRREPIDHADAAHARTIYTVSNLTRWLTMPHLGELCRHVVIGSWLWRSTRYIQRHGLPWASATSRTSASLRPCRHSLE